ncbi:MAG: hypothetical protein SFT92_09510 [Rickettsiales bacterium]|nr:hypothetical protein [Rickettsiales bacterium]
MKLTTLKIADAARDILRLYGYYVDNLWHVEDVHFICEQHNLPQLTNQEAMKIFSIVAEQFDGDAGISWPQLERAVHTYTQRKAAARKLQALES